MNGGGNLPVGPGIWGFIAFFVLAVALWLLVRNMNSRLRRMAYTDRERAQAAEAKAREAEGAAAGAAGADGAADLGQERGDGDQPDGTAERR